MDGRQPPHRRLLHGRAEDARDAARRAAAGQRHAHRVHRCRDRRDHRRAGRTWREVQSVDPLRRTRSATSARTATTAGIYYTSGARGPQGQVRAASWSPDGSRVVFHRRQVAPTTWWKSTWSRNPEFELSLTSIMPSFGRDGGRFVVDRPAAGRIDFRIEHRDRHAWIERRESRVSGHEAQRAGAAMGAERRENHLLPSVCSMRSTTDSTASF